MLRKIEGTIKYGNKVLESNKAFQVIRERGNELEGAKAIDYQKLRETISKDLDKLEDLDFLRRNLGHLKFGRFDKSVRGEGYVLEYGCFVIVSDVEIDKFLVVDQGSRIAEALKLPEYRMDEFLGRIKIKTVQDHEGEEDDDNII